MSAAMELHVALSLRLDAIEAYRLAHAYRAEVLAEAAALADPKKPEVSFFGQYGPQVAWWLRMLVGRREEATAAAATDPPGLTARQARLLDAIHTHGGEWTTRRVLHLFALTDPGVVQRGTARRDLTVLHRAGHLVLVDDPDKRHYALNHRKDRRP